MGKKSRLKKQKQKKAPAKPPPRPESVAPLAPAHPLLLPVTCLVLVTATILVFGQVATQDFVSYDDDMYVYENRYVRQGITEESLEWALAHPHLGNYHPLTYLSYLLDIQLFGVSAPAIKCVNLALHIANGLLLFFLLRRMTRMHWASAFVALLFLIHPLHVEPVAWVSCRKDTLSGLFFLLTLLAYTAYAAKPRVPLYLAMLLSYALCLLSKPVLVPLPFLLLLLDYWPLRRFSLEGEEAFDWALARTRIAEKIPLFAIMLVACFGIYYFATTGEVLGRERDYPLGVRIPNVIASYGKYIGQTLWPAGLSVHYPHRGASLPTASVVLSLAALAGLSVLGFLTRRKCPAIAIGWLWFLGMLVPVIGLVQIGGHASADRYTYIPLIGLFLMMGWGVPQLMGLKPGRSPLEGGSRGVLAAGLSILYATAMIAAAIFQTAHWSDSETLFRHAIAVTDRNDRMHNNLGNVLRNEGRMDEAFRQFTRAAEITPTYPEAHTNLGTLYRRQGNLDKALEHCRRAVELRPDYPDALSNLGNVYFDLAQYDEAVKHYEKAIRLSPEDAGAQSNLGNALLRLNQIDNAITQYRAAIRLDPANAEAMGNLGSALFSQNKLDEAAQFYRQALDLDPDYADAHSNLGSVLYNQGKLDEAAQHYLEAVRLNPKHADAFCNLGNLELKKGNGDKARSYFERALEVRPNHPRTQAALKQLTDAGLG